MSNQARFQRLVNRNGSKVTYHRESGGTVCPCVTPEGFRSPKWHVDNPDAVVCNEDGKLAAVVTDIQCRAFVQPVQSSRSTRMNSEYITEMFGQVMTDDHLGIFPLKAGSVDLDFRDWDQAGSEYVTYDDQRFIVVASNKIPDPANGAPHHWEIALRLVKNVRVVD